MSDESVSLELRSVVQRFNDSSLVLDQLRDRLRSLADAEETQSASSRSIDEASGELRRYTAELEGHTAALASAVLETKAALETVREFLQGTDLKAVREDVARLEQGQDAVRATSSRILALLEQELVDARKELDQTVHARQELEGKIAAVPEKTRRKLRL